MALRMMSALPARIIQVLIDYLPTELNLIDAEEADGITTGDIAAGNYYEWDRQTIPEYPACSIRVVSSSPIEIQPDLFGRQAYVRHRIDVMFHVTNKEGDALRLQKLLFRYVTGAMRVLCVMYEGLQTALDPVRYVSLVTWTDRAVYGPDEEQDDGSIVRTATLPLDVLTFEKRG